MMSTYSMCDLTIVWSHFLGLCFFIFKFQRLLSLQCWPAVLHFTFCFFILRDPPVLQPSPLFSFSFFMSESTRGTRPSPIRLVGLGTSLYSQSLSSQGRKVRILGELLVFIPTERVQDCATPGLLYGKLKQLTKQIRGPRPLLNEEEK